MNKKLAILVFLIAWILPANAQKTKIYGKVENAKAYVIKLKAYSDFFSTTEKVMDDCVIGDDGSFLLETELQSSGLHVLVIGFQKAFIYLQPNKEYQIAINYDKESEQITFVNKPQLDFQFIDLPADNLNSQIADFNLKANDFLVSNFDQIYKRRNKNLIANFSKEIKESLKNPSNFLKNYIEFRLASIEYSSGLKDRLAIFKDYFQNKKIHYGNDEYVQFFKELFDKYLMKPNPHFEIQQLRTEIFGGGDLELVFSVLNNDPSLQDREIKELVLLKGLYDFYFIPSINKATILSLINEMGKKTLFVEIEKIASNFQHQLTYLQPGSEFPTDYIRELDIENNPLKPLNKNIFINFFTIPCADCVREMDSIASIQKKYSDDVQFISIALNTSEDELKKLIEAKKYTWEIRLSSHPFELAETYQLKSLPAYFLIDSKAKILFNPALRPWRGFSESFQSMFKY